MPGKTTAGCCATLLLCHAAAVLLLYSGEIPAIVCRREKDSTTAPSTSKMSSGRTCCRLMRIMAVAPANEDKFEGRPADGRPEILEQFLVATEEGKNGTTGRMPHVSVRTTHHAPHTKLPKKQRVSSASEARSREARRRC